VEVVTPPVVNGRPPSVDLCPEGVVFEPMGHGQYFSNEEESIVEEQRIVTFEQRLHHLQRETSVNSPLKVLGVISVSGLCDVMVKPWTDSGMPSVFTHS
jgi:hypothetical protein